MADFRGPASESQRVMQLQKRRERAQEEIEFKRKKLADELKLDKMEQKFSAHYDAVETGLKAATVGLVTNEEMKKRQEEAVMAHEMALARKSKDELREIRNEEKARQDEKKKQKQQIKKLTFDMDDEEEDDDDEDDAACGVQGDIKKDPDAPEPSTSSAMSADAEKSGVKKRLGKNPDVDTSFLPDVDRDEEENKLRENLRKEWEENQRRIKEESIDITFSYWDGSGHRRSITMKKGRTIYQFLQKALEVLRVDFADLKTVTADQLMYVKEDLIIPQTNTFYDFIVIKARGKSGPLFAFDVHDDVRLVNDASVEKDESHAGKVVLRQWYERNKHIFPASRWEPYDPTKTYEKYTVADKR